MSKLTKKALQRKSVQWQIGWVQRKDRHRNGRLEEQAEKAGGAKEEEEQEEEEEEEEEEEGQSYWWD